jgi:hypothetical protein
LGTIIRSPSSRTPAYAEPVREQGLEAEQPFVVKGKLRPSCSFRIARAAS